MPARIRQIQSGWANGVISPRVLGRTDMDKYYASAEEVRDLIVLPQGGLKRRPGTQYVADAMGPSRLIPFVFSPGVAYILELGNQTMRFYYPYNDAAQSPTGGFQPPYTAGAQIQSGGSPLTLTTPFNTANISLWDIQYAQQGDEMYFVHPLYPVQKLFRYGTVGNVPQPTDTNWRLVQPNFKCPPLDGGQENDISGGTITLTPSATTGSITLTASASVWLQGDVGRYIVSGNDGAFCLITAYSSATVVTASVIDPFATTGTIPAGAWAIEGSPAVWAAIGSVNASNQWTASKQFGVGTNDTLFSYNSYPSQGNTVPTEVQSFRATDIGRYLSVSGCICQITGVVSEAEINIRYLSVPESTFTGTVAGEIRVQPSAPGAWSFQDALFNFGSVAFFQDRLILANYATLPKTIWGSVTGDYENFSKGTNASDSFEFNISGGKLDTIQWMTGTPVAGMLAIETDAAEYVASGGGGSVGATGEGITPTNINVQPNSVQGGSKLSPILVDSALVYIQRMRTKVFEFSYNIYQSSFSSKDLSLFAEHLTHAGIKEMAYQALPYKIIWYVTNDGRLIGMTYDRTQEVCAWHEHRTGYADNGYGAVGTGDRFISVASIPNPSTALLNPNGEGGLDYVGNADPSYSSDLVWVVVARKRNGSTVYCVELMNEDLMVDSASLQPTLTSSTEVTDSHLAGRMVVATGKPTRATKTYFPFDSILGTPAVADSSGDLTLEIPAASITAYGLPFQPTLTTVRPEARGGQGSMQGLKKRWSDLYLRFYQTLTANINGQVTSFQNVPGVLPSSPAASLEPGVLSVPNVIDTMSDEIPPITVDIRVHQLGYDRDGRVTVIQDNPEPMTVLAMYGTLDIGDN